MSDRDAVRRAYDAMAETYADERSAEGRGTEILTEFLDALPERPRVLDAGCGQGTPVLERLAAVGDPVGLDFSRQQLRLARETVPGAPLVRGDMTALPFESDAFDAVTAFHSLIHVPSDDHETVLAEFARVLRPGGRVLLTEGCEEWSGENPDWLDSGVEMQWDIAGIETTKKQLERAGFAVEDEWLVVDKLADDEVQKPFLEARLAE
ncbi:class I SAM-dependent methyltransferase [Halorussus gelatinilyticus]|uniref:Class I SAM-dependent methyltransferase n=1 Tax=Halorussus gelatinilyticus TaxID=2937524 RepID=A0A8U0ILS0_9EURY|nr:class I SAM-dependent methyltransferase [Halorussus gelatinilyticus]UPW01154.1 class I SAM-dependent methyltransferase [Halorussus gelatinilyticus]